METNEPLIKKLQVIILDLEKIEPEYLWGITSVVFAISIGCWLVVRLPRFDLELGPDKRELQAQVSRNDKTSQAETPTDVSKA